MAAASSEAYFVTRRGMPPPHGSCDSIQASGRPGGLVLRASGAHRAVFTSPTRLVAARPGRCAARRARFRFGWLRPSRARREFVLEPLRGAGADLRAPSS